MLSDAYVYKTHILRFAVLIALASALFAMTYAQGDELDAKAIGQAAGTKASVQEDGVVRVEWSRDDVPVTVGRMRLPPPAGLGSWAAFQAVPGGVMVMGDTVVFEDEITPAMDAAFAHGLKVTALHNHFIFDRPPVYFMHIEGHDRDAAPLAKGVDAIWDAIKAVRKAAPTPITDFSGRVSENIGKLAVVALTKILGPKPDVKSGVVKFSFGRKGIMHGPSIGSSMGVSTWAAFTGNGEYAAVDGDFAMTAEEVQPVMHALRDAGIQIVALHNHMIGGKPFYYFLHFWREGNPKDLARGVRSALDT
ncbi:MAG: DUF1259 domain-containing protein [Pseudomonadota bacterium]|nr:DUF1259 domain-containing protein [Pseudomonadota bacterium]